MSANVLPSYNAFGYLNANPAGATTQNPLVANPAGSNVNPLISSPAGGTAAPVTPGYQPNVTPGTQGGQGPFGAVPGTVGLPQPYSDLSSVFPDLGGSNSAISSDIMAELEGGLSPGTLGAIGQAQNSFGIAGPVNTSPLSLGETDQQIQSAGLGAYGGIIPTISTTQTVSPEVQAQIEEFNAQQAAAPNPTASEAIGGASAAIGLIGLLACDRNIKDKFETIDATNILKQVTNLPITKWEFKDQPGVKHIGPMAQDFHEIFKVGGSQRQISIVDALGVALAAIQALSSKVDRLENELSLSHAETNINRGRL